MKTLRALAALLSYPTAELVAAADEIREVLDREALLPAADRAALERLLDDLATGDLYDLQERYGLLFDRTRSLSLHLFEHVHGESRDRGQAMVDLQNHYAEHGLEIGASELPDFIPLFLEFLSTLPPSEASNLLGQPIHIISAIGERLAKRNSPYQGVFQALVSLSAELPKYEAVQEILARPDADPNDLEALDAAWEEEEVRFGPGADASCKDEIVAKVRAGRRPAPGVTVPSHKPIIQYSTGGGNA